MRYKLIAVIPDRNVVIQSFSTDTAAKLVAEFLDKELGGPVIVVDDDDIVDERIVWPE